MSHPLEAQLGYVFQDAGLLKLALTHRSADSDHNERLEFLGDAVLNLLMADVLFQRFPAAREGELSRLRSTLVNRDTLGKVALQLELGAWLVLGGGEHKAGGQGRVSILSCALEAVVGAIYLDAGPSQTWSVILPWFEDLLDTFSATHVLKDPKTRLQEYLQAHHRALPGYAVVATRGEMHAQTFTVSCTADDITVTAEGISRRRAEQAAALLMLERMLHDKKNKKI